MMLKSLLSAASIFLAAAASPSEDVKTLFSSLSSTHGAALNESELALHREKFTSMMSSSASESISPQELYFLSRPAVTEAQAEEINSRSDSSWKAGVSSRFNGMSVFDVKKLLGTDVENRAAWDELPESTPIFNGELPENFNAAENWSECTTIGHIRDQAHCGSCWAFGSTEAFNDRLCIATVKAGGEPFTQLLSPQHTAACCSFFSCLSFGCKGGQPARAWKWFVKNGVVSGGDYEDTDSGETCQPYEVLPSHRREFDDEPVPKLSCKKSCTSKKYPVPFNQDLHHAASSYSVKGIDNIKAQIYNNGPVTGAFFVYDDFMSYKSGVYSPSPSAKYLGGHAIKVIGWGKEDGEDYWIIVNSWSTAWGDNGTVKIKMGVANINDMMVAGDVEAASSSKFDTVFSL